MRSLDDILLKLKQLDTTDILELLDVSSEELVTALHDLVEERAEYVSHNLNQWFEEDADEEA